MRKIKHDLARYFLASLAVVVALLLRKLLDPFLGEQNPYLTLWVAIVFSAWYCGLGPSIVALVATLGTWYWFLPPHHSFGINSQADFVGMIGFLISCALIIAFGNSSRRSLARNEQAKDEVRKVQAQLENRVKERAAALEQKTAEAVEQAALLALVNDAIFVKNKRGEITYWNQGAERLYGWTLVEALGRQTHELLHTEYPIPHQEIESRDAWEGELRHTKRDGTQIVVSSRWTTLRDAAGEAVGWLELNTDITSRKRAEEASRRLSGRILSLQDDERRRIARELHDSLGQYLTALKMNLDVLAKSAPDHVALAAECSQIVSTCLAETRTLSHLLHPPLLDESGFGSAARWYVEGFAQRSGIKVNLVLPPEVVRLNKDVEIALFRAVQETLTNVHRHSGGSEVNIILSVDAEQVRLEIKDNGRGIPEERLNRLQEGAAESGVGIAGMRERLRELSGSFQIESDQSGTRIIVTTPFLEETKNEHFGHREPRDGSAA